MINIMVVVWWVISLVAFILALISLIIGDTVLIRISVPAFFVAIPTLTALIKADEG
jgi:hypothetical protein